MVQQKDFKEGSIYGSGIGARAWAGVVGKEISMGGGPLLGLKGKKNKIKKGDPEAVEERVALQKPCLAHIAKAFVFPSHPLNLPATSAAAVVSP